MALVTIDMPDKPNSSVRHFMTDDDLSLDSSASEEQEVYTVEEILAERLSDDSEILYLVKWEGYPEERCDISIFLTTFANQSTPASSC